MFSNVCHALRVTVSYMKVYFDIIINVMSTQRPLAWPTYVIWQLLELQMILLI